MTAYRQRHKIGDYVIENRAGPKAMVNEDSVKVMSTRCAPARRGHVVSLNGLSMEVRLLDGTTIADKKNRWSKMFGNVPMASAKAETPPKEEPPAESFPPAGNLAEPKPEFAPVQVGILRQTLSSALNIDIHCVRRRSGPHAGHIVAETIRQYVSETIPPASALAERFASRVRGLRIVEQADTIAHWRDTQDNLCASLILEQTGPIEVIPTDLCVRPCMAIVPVCPPPCRAIALFHGGAPA